MEHIPAANAHTIAHDDSSERATSPTEENPYAVDSIDDPCPLSQGIDYESDINYLSDIKSSDDLESEGTTTGPSSKTFHKYLTGELLPVS
jgi:hypothetical protein